MGWDLWGGLSSAWDTTTGFVADNWQTAAGIVVGTAVTAAAIAAAPEEATAAAAAAVYVGAGALGGMASMATEDVLNGTNPFNDGKRIMTAGVVSGALTLATLGVGSQYTAPIVDSIVGKEAGEGAMVLADAATADAAAAAEAPVVAAVEKVPTATEVQVAQLEKEAAPAPAPALTAEQAQERAYETAKTLSQDLRMPDGAPVSGKALDAVPRAVTAAVDRTTGQVYTGVTGGPLNEEMAQVFAQRGYDLPAIQKNLDVEGLKAALRDPEVRAVLEPTIADDILSKPESELIATDPSSGKPFLALPWNCSEIQATHAAIEAGVNPANLAEATTLARTNIGRIGETGLPFHSCPRCAATLGNFRIESVTDQMLAQRLGPLATDTAAATAPESAGLLDPLGKVSR